MAADVSSLVRVLNGYKDDRTAGSESVGGKPKSLITQDLLGGGGGGGGGGGVESMKNECQELDLDLQVPSGWEKRLDLKSGKIYLQRCNSSSSVLSYHKHQTNQTGSNLRDLNFPRSLLPSKPFLNLFDETNLELKLVSPSSSPQSSSINYQSVCTLDKVKSALERANKEPNNNYRKRSKMLWSASLSPSYSSSSSSIKDVKETEEKVLSSSSSPTAAGCPGCLCYVLIMKNNPKCPRCNSMVPMPTMKKPKLDLNMSI